MVIKLITATNDLDLATKMRGERNCTIYLIGHWKISNENLQIAEMSNIKLEPINRWVNKRYKWKWEASI